MSSIIIEMNEMPKMIGNIGYWKALKVGSKLFQKEEDCKGVWGRYDLQHHREKMLLQQPGEMKC
jgi:hypothetical protein